jgi:hypothetical protein
MIASHHTLGASTRRRHPGTSWETVVAAACDIFAFAAELTVRRADELEGLLAFLDAEPDLPFRYVSVRASGVQGAQLCRLPLDVVAVVVDPGTIEDVEAFRQLGWRAVVESVGSIASLHTVFAALPDAGLSLDIHHPDGVEILDAFAGRLRQVRISSLDDDRRFQPLLDRCRDVPWIVD